ncbi:glycosyltransferase family 2 protein [Flavobacterium aurantiibacter]|uniref:Glycosyltransferase 2-like domain-containing protein n=1 Tax=Flavobacterium aurantiibacter TaxID=2023067 RepID=A0A256A2U7_9FLAO|nr:glycosyltransferase family 2 protein [Flavobacterium aurantiibacter]OYQ47424.1 hypothetical protein CHX27_03090 [Flavobacterium aurantiibacter]
MKKLPISAIIASRNEGHLLEECLNSIQFCSEIIIIDLNSTDNTQEIAQSFDARIIRETNPALVEELHVKYCTAASNDWLLTYDPDEVVSEALAAEICELFERDIADSKSHVMAPIRYYFKNRMLKGTSWGGLKYRTFLVNRNRYTFSGKVHLGGAALGDWTALYIPYRGNNHIHHYWMQSWNQLLEKHCRYLEKEGEARFSAGERTNLLKIVKTPFTIFFKSFVKARGVKDGLTGFLLSLFRAWYFTTAQIRLLKYQNNRRK